MTLPVFGSVTNLTGGSASLSQSQTSGQNYFWIQNNDTNPILLTFLSRTGGVLGQWVLNPAVTSGWAGDTLDSVQMPAFLDAVTVQLTGTGSGQFSSGASTRTPFNTGSS